MSIDEQIDTLDSQFTSYEKVSWKRKDKNIKKLVAEMEPIQEQILELTVERNRLMDKIKVIRQQMVLECIHPRDELIAREDDSLFCKFCERTMGVIQRNDSE